MSEPTPLYSIQAMRPEVQTGRDGKLEQGYRVDFTTAVGQYSHVFVPRSDTLDDDVHRAVEAEARKIVGTMTRTSIPPHVPPIG